MAGYEFDERKHTYVLTNENSVAVALRNIDNLQLKDLVIKSDEDYKSLYECRTILNKNLKEVQTLRKQMVMAVTGQFQVECKAIEKAIVEATTEMTERLNAYKPKTNEKKVFKLVIKTDNTNALDKIRTMALKYGCEVTQD